ncbi:cell cycle progression protein 1 isoform X1 [Acanthochromis polyacanthus]|uniref:cell cycle progression protein 1 isoform X1 n=1 Tax=Acanthochromis polyacanthus TaxID=80966 RepID=UPI002234707E|nr:cell cycle progression protein 1 isoform X1 [Acanthochromis polyacanthus]
MSETSSDAESSCGWTIISNEGSDIETLGTEAAVEFAAELVECPPVEEPELQDAQASESGAVCVEERSANSLDGTLGEQTVAETLYASEAGGTAKGKEHVLSSSDHSDIVTLGDLKDEEHTEREEEAAGNEEFYLGTSCSSQYAFTAAETGLLLSHWKLPQSLVNLSYHLRSHLTGGSFPVFPVQQPRETNSSSSEDEAGRSTMTVVRRRRLRKNTTSVMTDPEEEAVLESRPSDEDEEKEEEEAEEETQQEEDWTEVRPTAAVNVRDQGQSSSILNKCILLALIVAISMGFGHFYGTFQIQERQHTRDKIRVNELYGVRDLLHRHVRDQLSMNQDQSSNLGLDDLDEQKVISLLTEMIEKIKKENQELNLKKVHFQAQRDGLEVLLKQKAEEKTSIVSQQQRLTAENQLLKSSLEREEKSLSTLQEELRNLRSKIRDLEVMGAGADSLLAENQRLKDQLEEEKQLLRKFHGQREDMVAEAQTLRKKLDRERKVTDELRRELNRLRSRIPGAGKEADSEAEQLQSRLMELEKRLSFEQQRSDLWERLYVETKEERAKGDTESKVKKPKEGMPGKVKETFDAVKNSTKEFVHHHKEQIKKAKEAVKENLRKFSDSVKSTFRHFKDSASNFINKARGFYNKKCDEKNTKESWQHRSHKHHHRHKSDSFQSSCNTRKSGGKVHEDRGQGSHKANMKGCSGVFDCAYQESMSLFNKAMEPIRADEFYQLLQSYLQQEVDHFYHWKELEMFINNFFHNGVFIHDQMLFTDFVSGVEDYLADMHEYHGLNDDVFGDLDDYVYRHFFGESYIKSYGPSGPFERPDTDSKEELRAKHHQRKHQRAKSRPHSERKWSRSGRNADRHMADVKIELGPMPFDPKY